MASSDVSAIIPCAGRGRRMGEQANKLFLELNGRPVVAVTLATFQACDLIGEVIVIAHPDEVQRCREIQETYGFSKVREIVPGGLERQDSVYEGLLVLDAACRIVVIHDGARPLVTGETIARAVEEARKSRAVAMGVPVKDTVKEVAEDGRIVRTLDRKVLWAVHTPQVFDKEVVLPCYEEARKEGFRGTDDSSIVERYGYEVKMLQDMYENIKITTKEDLIFAEAVLRGRKWNCV